MNRRRVFLWLVLVAWPLVAFCGLGQRRRGGGVGLQGPHVQGAAVTPPIATEAQVAEMQRYREAMRRLASIFGKPPEEVPHAIAVQRLEAIAVESGDLASVAHLVSRKRAKFLRKDGVREVARIKMRLAEADTVLRAAGAL